MHTLKNDIEQALPRFDTATTDVADLIAAGRKEVLRRRMRVGRVMATGGLVVAAAAWVATVTLSEGGPLPVPSPQPTGTQVQDALTLVSLKQVAQSCEGVSLDAANRRLTAQGQVLDATHEAHEAGWTAAEYACGSVTIRVVQVDGDTTVLGRYEAPTDSLTAWAKGQVAEHPSW